MKVLQNVALALAGAACVACGSAGASPHDYLQQRLSAADHSFGVAAHEAAQIDVSATVCAALIDPKGGDTALLIGFGIKGCAAENRKVAGTNDAIRSMVWFDSDAGATRFVAWEQRTNGMHTAPFETSIPGAVGQVTSDVVPGAVSYDITFVVGTVVYDIGANVKGVAHPMSRSDLELAARAWYDALTALK